LGGWARIASDGLVGKARADGETAANEVLRWLKQHTPQSADLATCQGRLRDLLQQKQHPFVEYTDVLKLQAIEQARADALGVPLFKFDTNEEMLAAIRNA
jgi:hypothetical protein